MNSLQPAVLLLAESEHKLGSLTVENAKKLNSGFLLVAMRLDVFTRKTIEYVPAGRHMWNTRSAIDAGAELIVGIYSKVASRTSTCPNAVWYTSIIKLSLVRKWMCSCIAVVFWNVLTGDVRLFTVRGSPVQVEYCNTVEVHNLFNNASRKDFIMCDWLKIN